MLNAFFAKTLAENNMATSNWCDIVPLVEMLFNHSPVESLGGYAPISIFTGLEPSRPITAFHDKVSGKMLQLSLPENIHDSVNELRTLLAERAAKVCEIQEQAFAKRNSRLKKQRGVDFTIFQVGDFVMVQPQKQQGKLTPKWIGPARVIKIEKDFHIHVEFLAEGELTNQKTFHARHVRFFDYAEMTVSHNAKKFAEYLAQKQHNVSQLLDFRLRHDTPYVQVEWSSGDITWEPLSVIYETCSDLVHGLLHELQDRSDRTNLVRTIREKLLQRRGDRRDKRKVHFKRGKPDVYLIAPDSDDDDFCKAPPTSKRRRKT